MHVLRLITLTATLSIATTAQGQTLPHVASVDTMVARIRHDSATPFIDIAIVTSERLCHVASYGESGAPIAEGIGSTPPRFHSASVSKLFTAIAIMQLVDDNKLALSHRVGEYVPEFAASPTTLAQLLTHTAGLRDRDDAQGRRTAKQVDDYIAALARQRTPVSDAPWRYSDANYNLLGRVIERVTGQSFADAMRERVLAPLGMSDSDFQLDRIPAGARVVGHRNQRALPHPWDLAFLPSSGLQTTAADLGKFAQAVLKVHAGIATAGLVSTQSLSAMTRSRAVTEWMGVEQGYGWQLGTGGGALQWRHAGGERGFESLLTVYPERNVGIVVFGNKDDWPRFELEAALRKAALAGKAGCPA